MINSYRPVIAVKTKIDPMKIPSYFTTLKVLLVIILAGLLVFIVQQYSRQKEADMLLIKQTREQNDAGAAAIMFLLVTAAFCIVILLNKHHRRVKTKRHRQLIQAQSKFEDTLRSIGDPFFGLDADYNIIYCNQAFQKMTGDAGMPLTGINLYTAFRQFNTPAIHQNFVQVFETGKPASFELYDYFYDNWKDVNIYPVAGGVSVLMKDASLRKKYETELKTAMQFLEETNTIGLIGGWELDVATGKVTWTNETCNIHETEPGYHPDLKNAISFYKAGYSRDTITHAVKDAIENGTHWDKMLQIVTLKGKEIWVRAIGRPELENGEVIKLIGTFQDVQQQKNMLDKLIETEQKFDAVFEHSTKAKLLLDQHQRIMDANQPLLEHTGYKKEDILHKPLSAISLQYELSPGRAIEIKWKEQIHLLHKEGFTLEAHINGAAIKDKNGSLACYLLNIDF